MTPTYIYIDETPSTNAHLKSLVAADDTLPHGTVLYTHRQTAGRGQRGNSWEAAPAMNVTMSMLLRPDVEAREQFRVSEAVALGVARYVARELGAVAPVKVKWPNDIYVADKKIAGILIENSLQGSRIGHSVAGIGLNVNQREFLSDAPNPTSLFIIGGETRDVDEAIRAVADAVLHYLTWPADKLHEQYLSTLWRRDGRYYPYTTPGGERFGARIVDVSPSGMLTLVDEGGVERVYAFKEVAAVI